MSRTRVIQVGLGPIGRFVAERLAEEPELELVGGVDSNPEIAGRTLKSVLGIDVATDARVVADVDAARKLWSPDVAVLTTVSDLPRLLPQAETLLRAGVAVVSTCEEMAYPKRTRPAETERLDAAARAGGVACVGCGINPGFVLDVLPMLLCTPLGRVTGLVAERVVDASKRRGPLQAKIGAGLTPIEFAAKVAQGGFGHRGMLESWHFIADTLGIPSDGVKDFIEPVISERQVRTPFVSVEPGQVAGIHQGARDPAGRLILDIKMYVGALEPRDEVRVFGEPSLRVVVDGGYEGDRATAWITVNAARAIRRVAPGFRTTLDLLPFAAPRVRV